MDRENRRSRSKFECKLCGKSLHADVNASRNLLSRAKWEVRLHSMKRALIRQVELFHKNLLDERYKCLRGKALKPEAWINVNKKDVCNFAEILSNCGT